MIGAPVGSLLAGGSTEHPATRALAQVLTINVRGYGPVVRSVIQQQVWSQVRSQVRMCVDRQITRGVRVPGVVFWV